MRPIKVVAGELACRNGPLSGTACDNVSIVFVAAARQIGPGCWCRGDIPRYQQCGCFGSRRRQLVAGDRADSRKLMTVIDDSDDASFD